MCVCVCVCVCVVEREREREREREKMRWIPNATRHNTELRRTIRPQLE